MDFLNSFKNTNDTFLDYQKIQGENYGFKKN